MSTSIQVDPGAIAVNPLAVVASRRPEHKEEVAAAGLQETKAASSLEATKVEEGLAIINLEELDLNPAPPKAGMETRIEAVVLAQIGIKVASRVKVYSVQTRVAQIKIKTDGAHTTHHMKIVGDSTQIAAEGVVVATPILAENHGDQIFSMDVLDLWNALANSRQTLLWQG
jgi:hypothetical protein